MSPKRSRDPVEKARGMFNLHLAAWEADTERVEKNLKAMRARLELMARDINVLKVSGVVQGIEIERIHVLVSQTTSLKEVLHRELDMIGELLERIQKSIE